MNILHIISSSGVYGAENVLLNLLEKFKEDSAHKAYLVCLRSKGKDEPDIYFQAQKRGINSKVLFCEKKIDKEVINSLIGSIEKERIDIIHTHGYKANFYGLQVSKKSGVPVVATLHGWTGENLKVKFYDMFDKENIKKMNFAICVSPKIKEQLIKSRMSEEKVSFIPNGIDVQKFDDSRLNQVLRGELGLHRAVVIGTVGRLSPEKGHKYLLEAFKEIVDVYDEARLLIVGEGEMKKELEDLAEKMNIKESVIFAGKRDDMPEIYHCMDIFVLPSLTEGIPVALLEAMSMKLPVVATKVGGVPYVIDGDEGKLVEKEKSRELAESISTLIETKNNRLKLGERARKKVEENFSVEQMIKKYLEVYKKILS